MLSIIVPVLDEEAGIVATLRALSALRARGAEVIVATARATTARSRLPVRCATG
jgi:hypothetical protein